MSDTFGTVVYNALEARVEAAKRLATERRAELLLATCKWLLASNVTGRPLDKCLGAQLRRCLEIPVADVEVIKTVWEVFKAGKMLLSTGDWSAMVRGICEPELYSDVLSHEFPDRQLYLAELLGTSDTTACRVELLRVATTGGDWAKMMVSLLEAERTVRRGLCCDVLREAMRLCAGPNGRAFPEPVVKTMWEGVAQLTEPDVVTLLEVGWDIPYLAWLTQQTVDKRPVAHGEWIQKAVKKAADPAAGPVEERLRLLTQLAVTPLSAAADALTASISIIANACVETSQPLSIPFKNLELLSRKRYDKGQFLEELRTRLADGLPTDVTYRRVMLTILRSRNDDLDDASIVRFGTTTAAADFLDLVYAGGGTDRFVRESPRDIKRLLASRSVWRDQDAENSEYVNILYGTTGPAYSTRITVFLALRAMRRFQFRHPGHPEPTANSEARESLVRLLRGGMIDEAAYILASYRNKSTLFGARIINTALLDEVKAFLEGAPQLSDSERPMVLENFRLAKEEADKFTKDEPEGRAVRIADAGLFAPEAIERLGQQPALLGEDQVALIIDRVRQETDAQVAEQLLRILNKANAWQATELLVGDALRMQLALSLHVFREKVERILVSRDAWRGVPWRCWDECPCPSCEFSPQPFSLWIENSDDDCTVPRYRGGYDSGTPIEVCSALECTARVRNGLAKLYEPGFRRNIRDDVSLFRAWRGRLLSKDTLWGPACAAAQLIRELTAELMDEAKERGILDWLRGGKAISDWLENRRVVPRRLKYRLGEANSGRIRHLLGALSSKVPPSCVGYVGTYGQFLDELRWVTAYQPELIVAESLQNLADAIVKLGVWSADTVFVPAGVPAAAAQVIRQLNEDLRDEGKEKAVLEWLRSDVAAAISEDSEKGKGVGIKEALGSLSSRVPPVRDDYVYMGTYEQFLDELLRTVRHGPRLVSGTSLRTVALAVAKSGFWEPNSAFVPAGALDGYRKRGQQWLAQREDELGTCLGTTRDIICQVAKTLASHWPELCKAESLKDLRGAFFWQLRLQQPSWVAEGVADLLYSLVGRLPSAVSHNLTREFVIRGLRADLGSPTPLWWECFVFKVVAGHAASAKEAHARDRRRFVQSSLASACSRADETYHQWPVKAIIGVLKEQNEGKILEQCVLEGLAAQRDLPETAWRNLCAMSQQLREECEKTLGYLIWIPQRLLEYRPRTQVGGREW